MLCFGDMLDVISPKKLCYERTTTMIAKEVTKYCTKVGLM
jgi:hypothetical protein